MKKGIKWCLVMGAACLIIGTGMTTAALAMGADVFYSISNDFRWHRNGNRHRDITFTSEDTFTDIDKLKVDCSVGDIRYEVGTADVVTVKAENAERYSWRAEGGTLKISSNHRRFANDNSCIVIQVPEGFVWDEIDLDMSASSFYAETLSAKSAKMDLSASSVNINGGELGTLSVDSRAGSVKCKAVVQKEAELDCSAGEIIAWLEGTPEDYKTKVSSSMGDVQVGDMSLSAMHGERKYNNEAGRKLDIDCNVGSVRVNFTES